MTLLDSMLVALGDAVNDSRCDSESEGYYELYRLLEERKEIMKDEAFWREEIELDEINECLCVPPPPLNIEWDSLPEWGKEVLEALARAEAGEPAEVCPRCIESYENSDGEECEGGKFPSACPECGVCKECECLEECECTDCEDDAWLYE